VLKLCVGHIPPCFDASNYVFVTSNQSAASNFNGRSVVLSDQLGFSKGYDGGVLSEYQQLFELQPSIKACAGSFDYLHITQYRKFISHMPGKRTAASMPHLYLCNSQEADFLTTSFEKKITATSLNRPILLCSHFLHLSGSYVNQYSKLHLIDDYVRFLYSINKVCQFSSSTFKMMTEARTFFPTPSLGLIPTSFYIKVVETLESVWSSFISDGFLISREGYQRRVGGFLLERLHSLLYLNAIYNNEVIISPQFQYIIGAGDAIPSDLYKQTPISP
jgi:hypothetical protein